MRDDQPGTMNGSDTPTASHDVGWTAPYLGASESELRAAGRSTRLLAMADQRRLFPHQGTLDLGGASLSLGGWRTLTPSQVTSVELTFTDAYSRWMASGVRGGRYSSFGLFGSLGKPLVLHLNGEDSIYLLIDFRWLTGINSARAWAPRFTSWAAGTDVR